MSRLLALYPSPWRERYGDEFAALVAARPLSTRARLDIVRGAVDARLHPQVGGPERVPDRAGLGTLAGLGLLLLAVFLMATGPEHYDEYGTYRDGSAALLPFVAAVGLLSFGIVRLAIRLPASSAGGRFAAAMAVAAGSLWSLFPWMLVGALAFFLSIAVLGVIAWRARVLPAWAAFALVVLLVGPIAACGASMILPWYVWRQAGATFIALLAPLLGVWLVVGLALLRGFPRRVRS